VIDRYFYKHYNTKVEIEYLEVSLYIRIQISDEG
jgi:hypothetical protein